ncbi:MAG: hypothetical protein U0270_32755 [Labilithrix sp.]
MNTLADKRASSAFVTTLREEPSTASLHAAFTQKTSTDNVVKVDGLASAIARAEEVIRERVRSGSRPDIFEQLVASDDASGPALYQPYIPTPIPPRSSTLPPPPPSTLTSLHAELAAPARVSSSTCFPASIVVLDPQAFYHPPAPPAAFAPARPRRNAFGAFAIAFVAPLVAVALIIGGISDAKARKADHGVDTNAVSVTHTNAATMPVSLETSAPVVSPSARIEPSNRVDEPPMLVVEVKALKSAPQRKSRR